METVSISKSTYEKYKKWTQGITLKEFEREVRRLGLTIEENRSNLNWNIKVIRCTVATIDPINECTMQTSKQFYKFHFRDELFELLTNLAYTCKEDRHLADYFEEWQYEE